MVIDYDELIDNAIEFNKKYTILEGVVDVHKLEVEFSIKDISENSYWIISGHSDYNLIKDAFVDINVDVEREGEYEFKAVLIYYPGEVDYYGRPTSKDYLYVEYIKFNFIQSFEARERESKINSLLGNNLFDI